MARGQLWLPQMQMSVHRVITRQQPSSSVGRHSASLPGGLESHGSSWAFVAEAAVGAHFFGTVAGHAATHADVAFAIHLFAFGDWAVAVFAFAAGLEVRAMAEPNKRGRLVDADPGD